MIQEDNAENRLKRTAFLVEATSFEQFCIWRENACKDNHDPRFPLLTWEQLGGWLIEIGSLRVRGKKLPCVISATWNRVDGQLVMFWYSCSRVTDSVQAEKWLDKHFNGKWDNGTRRATTDASNFHHCVSAIREINKLADGIQPDLSVRVVRDASSGNPVPQVSAS